MAVIQTIVCDKCGEKWAYGNENGNEIVTIGLCLGFGKTTIGTQDNFAIIRHWCRTCVMRHGIKWPISDTDRRIAPAVQPSEDDRIALVLEDMGFVRE